METGLSSEAPMRVLEWAVFSAHPARLHCCFSSRDGQHTCDPQQVLDLTDPSQTEDLAVHLVR